MTHLRSTAVAILLTLAAAPALAEGFTLDLPRLDFPTAPEATRASADLPSTDVTGQEG